MAQKQFSKFSVVIPSYNRIDEIQDLVHSFQNLGFDRTRFEVIIIDDGSTDDTIEFLNQYTTTANFNLKYYSQKNQGPGAARNKGMEKSDGDFLIFIDSDCTVPENWLYEIDKNLTQFAGDAYGGPDTYRDNFSPTLKAINYSMTSFITTGGLRGKKGKKLAKFYPRSFNMGLSRDLWERIGGFGSLRHGQDIEFSHRILKSGAKVIYIDAAPVYHKRRTNIRQFYKQVFNWGVARINLYTIDSTMLEPLHILPGLFTLLTFSICILAFIYAPIKLLLFGGLAIGALILVYTMIDAAFFYGDIRPGLLLPLILPAQIFGYGCGFIYNFIRRIILGKKETIGFRRKYYK